MEFEPEEGQGKMGDLGEVDSTNILSGGVDGLKQLVVGETRTPG